VVYHRGVVLIVIGVIAGQAGRPQLTYTYASNTTNAALTMSSISGYVSGKSDITITINSGIYLWSNSTATPGFALTGGAAGDTVKIVNNGFIMGMGGSANSGVGGTALSLSFNTTVDNTNASAYIGGGGGGGSVGTYYAKYALTTGGGGGAGGGAGGPHTYTSGGAGGAIGAVGANGGQATNSGGGGGGGGRIFPGTGGAGAPAGNGYAGSGRAGSGGGAGGGGGNNISSGAGGTGGAGNAAGAAGGGGGGGGGGWGASGNGVAAAGGAGGKAVALNGKTITWVSGNTTRVYGAVS